MTTHQRDSRANTRMLSLDPPTLTAADAGRVLDGRLSAVLDEGFEEVAGCVVLRRFADSSRRTSPTDHGDETGFEAFINHLHIEDVLDAATSVSELLTQTMAFAVCLGEQLVVAYPATRFEIIISVGDSYTVRFTTARPDQPSWLADDLEGYQVEAVMAFVVPGSPT